MPAYLAWRSRVSCARLRTRASRLAVDEARQAVGQPGVERAVAREEALIEQADVQLDIRSCTSAHSAGVRTEWLTRRPASHRLLQERRDGLLAARQLPFDGEQQQQVDVGIRKQLPPAVAAHRQHGDAATRRRETAGARRHPSPGGRLRRCARQARSAHRRSPGIAGGCATRCR